MKKFEKVVQVIFIVAIIIGVLCASIIFGKSLIKDTNTKKDNSNQILIEVYTGYNFHIVYDKETMVEYYRAEDVMVPLYNPDGTLKTYKKE